LKALVLGVLVGSAWGCAGGLPAEPPSALSDGRYAMGTVLEITLHAPGAAARPVFDALFAVAERLDRQLSVYDPDSDLSRVNARAADAPQAVPPEVAEVLRRAQSYTELSGGAFDITVGPLVTLWTQAAERGALPSAADLAQARARVGPDVFRVDDEDRVHITRRGARLDLGGIAKGYALDWMLPLLRERGIANALLAFGQSSTWALGAPPGQPGWRLLVRGPDASLLGIITLRDRALSVSGSLAQFVEIGGRRFGHVLDPRSGQPLVRRRQALVVAPDATAAEALSLALLILGEREGVSLIEAQPGCEGLLVDAAGGRWATPGWQEAVAFEPF
jgi:thiamine biosynthesis lipoprotein